MNVSRETFRAKNKRKSRVFAADFETTVYEGQKDTEVWAAAAVELFSDDVKIWTDISGLWEYLVSLKESVICYFHNLKFDGEFILNYLMRFHHFKNALNIIGAEDDDRKIYSWKKTKEMENGELRYSISHMGQWYSITAKVKGKIIELRDSLKLLPFSVREIGKAFKTSVQKSSIEYVGERHAFGTITPEEEEYIKGDVFIIKEALETMYEQGHDKLTIGSCCMSQWKQTMDKKDYENWILDLSNTPYPYGEEFANADAYIRRGYHGGWTYVAPDKQGKILKSGCTFDVNSLYPSVMHSSSGNYYPVGEPQFWQGDEIPEKAKVTNRFYYLRFKCRFYLKPGKLPFIQIKHDMHYKPTENLTTSDYLYKNQYYSHKADGTPITATLTCSKVDYELIREHYDLVDMEILDGCWFRTEKGIFDEYINEFAKIKQTSTGAMRTLAKLFLNNLYGKLGANDDSSFKIGELDESGAMRYFIQEEHGKQCGYVAAGAAVTSYARAFTIRVAQKNYNPGKPGFCYADTDSIHCDIKASEVLGVIIHTTDFNAWKHESDWSEAVFIRQKTYMEKVDGRWDIKCAGMPENCKELFARSMSGIKPAKRERARLGAEKTAFLRKKRDVTDFTYGLCVPGKLVPKHYPGGIVLEEVTFSIK